MRVLVVGAGGVGGYFGGRLLEAGRDVTFLVRERRAAELASGGLEIRSPRGDVRIPSPPTVTSDSLRSAFDLVVVSCKAYDLGEAVESVAPAVGPNTTILPLLNGMSHLDALDHRFGGEKALGGFCVISSTVDSAGRILHLNDVHSLSFGERSGAQTARIDAVARTLSGAGFDALRSDQILQEMWEKWVFIAATAGLTCLMRATVGDIVTAGGSGLARNLLAECAAIAADNGFNPREAAIARSLANVTAAGSPMAASMLRDIERGGRAEGDHILGDLLRRASGGEPGPSLLSTAYLHLKAYEVRRAREMRDRR